MEIVAWFGITIEGLETEVSVHNSIQLWCPINLIIMIAKKNCIPVIFSNVQEKGMLDVLTFIKKN